MSQFLRDFLPTLRKLENLYILYLNEAAITVNDQVKIEMQRLRSEGPLELCYIPLYKIDPCKIKIAFNNARSLHMHFKDIQFEPKVLSADVVGFAESRLCERDVVVVVLLFYVHGKHLRSCRDGQLT